MLLTRQQLAGYSMAPWEWDAAVPGAQLAAEHHQGFLGTSCTSNVRIHIASPVSRSGCALLLQ
jgi:hypothetical protein